MQLELKMKIKRGCVSSREKQHCTVAAVKPSISGSDSEKESWSKQVIVQCKWNLILDSWNLIPDYVIIHVLSKSAINVKHFLLVILEKNPLLFLLLSCLIFVSFYRELGSMVHFWLARLVKTNTMTHLMRNLTGRNQGKPQKGKSSLQRMRIVSLISGTCGVMWLIPV